MSTPEDYFKRPVAAVATADQLVSTPGDAPLTPTDDTAPADCIPTRIDTRLHHVHLNAQLAKTANGVRLLARNLARTTLQINVRRILIVTKARDNLLVFLTREMTEWLFATKHDVEVYVDHHLEKSSRFDVEGMLADVPLGATRLKFWTKELVRLLPEIFDLVVTLGGDGTVLYVLQMFQHIVPPVMCFLLGLLGFLTGFRFEQFRPKMLDVLNHGAKAMLRMRLTARVHRANGSLVTQQQVLNEVVIDRGPLPFIVNLELYGDGRLLTVVQADGLIVATPTGLTAYSLLAGGSIVHPSVAAISVTPICPHTLSFRPVQLPDLMLVKVVVPVGARSNAHASFDGHSRFELTPGCYVTIHASHYPFPTVRAGKNEFFDSVNTNLNWNAREKQKPFALLLSAKNRELYEAASRRALVVDAAILRLLMPPEPEFDINGSDSDLSGIGHSGETTAGTSTPTSYGAHTEHHWYAHPAAQVSTLPTLTPSSLALPLSGRSIKSPGLRPFTHM